MLNFTLDNTILLDMMRFFLTNMFSGIPDISCHFGPAEGFVLGKFLLKRSSKYLESKDPVAGKAGYIPRHYFLCGGLIDSYQYDIEPWEDPLNHPKPEIIISDALADFNHMLSLTGTLLHELTHYYCWYIGLDYKDEDKDFHNRLLRMGLPTNWSSMNESKVKEYLQLFLMQR